MNTEIMMMMTMTAKATMVIAGGKAGRIRDARCQRPTGGKTSTCPQIRMVMMMMVMVMMYKNAEII